MNALRQRIVVWSWVNPDVAVRVRSPGEPRYEGLPWSMFGRWAGGKTRPSSPPVAGARPFGIEAKLKTWPRLPALIRRSPEPKPRLRARSGRPQSGSCCVGCALRSKSLPDAGRQIGGGSLAASSHHDGSTLCCLPVERCRRWAAAPWLWHVRCCWHPVRCHRSKTQDLAPAIPRGKTQDLAPATSLAREVLLARGPLAQGQNSRPGPGCARPDYHGYQPACVSRTLSTQLLTRPRAPFSDSTGQRANRRCPRSVRCGSHTVWAG